MSESPVSGSGGAGGKAGATGVKRGATGVKPELGHFRGAAALQQTPGCAVQWDGSGLRAFHLCLLHAGRRKRQEQETQRPDTDGQDYGEAGCRDGGGRRKKTAVMPKIRDQHPPQQEMEKWRQRVVLQMEEVPLQRTETRCSFTSMFSEGRQPWREMNRAIHEDVGTWIGRRDQKLEVGLGGSSVQPPHWTL